jgi:hypothetical protein
MNSGAGSPSIIRPAWGSNDSLRSVAVGTGGLQPLKAALAATSTTIPVVLGLRCIGTQLQVLIFACRVNLRLTTGRLSSEGGEASISSLCSQGLNRYFSRAFKRDRHSNPIPITTMRVGLFTPRDKNYKKKGMTTDVTFIEATQVAEVLGALGGLGAKRVGLFYRDNAGAGHLEGELFAVGDLKQENLDWVAGKGDAYQQRGLFYVKD